MSNELKTFYVTKKAPMKILGKRHKGARNPIKLTEGQAEHLLRTLQISREEPKAAATKTQTSEQKKAKAD